MKLELPAEALITGQRVRDLFPTPAAVLGVQGEKVAFLLLQRQTRIPGQKGEVVVVLTPQRQFHSLGEEVVVLPNSQPERRKLYPPNKDPCTWETIPEKCHPSSWMRV